MLFCGQFSPVGKCFPKWPKISVFFEFFNPQILKKNLMKKKKNSQVFYIEFYYVARNIYIYIYKFSCFYIIASFG